MTLGRLDGEAVGVGEGVCVFDGVGVSEEVEEGVSDVVRVNVCDGLAVNVGVGKCTATRPMSGIMGSSPVNNMLSKSFG